MPAYRFFAIVVLGCLIAGLGAQSVQSQTLPATAAPSQMVPYGAPVAYPSTDPLAANNGGSVVMNPYAAAAPSTPGAPLPYESTASPRLAQVPSDPSVTYAPAPTNDFAAFQAPSTTSAAPADANSLSSNTFSEHMLSSNEPWTWQILPTGFMYKPNLADVHEYRFGTQWSHYRNEGWMWESTIGARAGIVRYGTSDALMPQGWQWDFEGAVFPKLNTTGDRDLVGDDFRLGIPVTMRQGPFEMKFGYCHLSSHIGDEYLLKHWTFPRINYVRESLILGFAMYLNPSLRLYSEAGWAFYTDGGAEPWEFQFGLDYSSPEPTGLAGSPFFALNTHLRQENNYSGSFTMMTGWQWRGQTGHLFRLGMQYFNGMSEQYQFFRKFEESIGAGLWYDY